MRLNLRGERAQGVIEFALLLPILALFFLGTVDLSRFLYYQNAIENAARVGAETAANHCTDRWDCAKSNTPTTDDWVMQATVCEAAPAVQLLPQIPCGPPAPVTSGGSCSAYSPCVPSPCTSSCTPCVNDVCISPSGTRTTHEQFTVWVGYDFQPIAPFWHALNLFPEISCYTGDDPSVNHHTLCASATGQVS